MIATLERLLAGDHLDAADAEELFGVLAEPSTAPALAAGLLVALRAKGETSEEIRGLARAMRSRALPCDLGPRDGLVDIVGTGGDGTSSLNLSTGAALLAAAAGARVVKHGGGAVSGRSGSADVLCALGVTLPRSDEEARALLEATGFTFLHAPRFHVALRGLGPVRRALGTRTVLNVLGPLCNPAAPPFGVIGAFSLDTARIMAEALAGLAIERAFVVHGAMGWDEPTPIGAFHLFDVSPHHVTASFRDPLDAGLPRCCPDELRGDVASLNARALIAVFDGEHSAHRDALVLGAALALEVSGRCRSMDEGVVAAAAALDDGRAAGLLAVVAAFPARASGELHA